uniref:DUF4440 domain-containing protein n=1 Tax=Solibacter usitatus (strain Ellin6076) TaxID=234267 RepID=Q025W6_SOLUE
MKAVVWILLAASLAHADERVDAVRKAIAAFNDLRERAGVLTADADLSPLERFGGQELSQVYFEVRSIKFLSGDVAFVDATASQFGSTIMKRARPAYFVMRKVGGEWRIAVMRMP